MKCNCRHFFENQKINRRANQAFVPSSALILYFGNGLLNDFGAAKHTHTHITKLTINWVYVSKICATQATLVFRKWKNPFNSSFIVDFLYIFVMKKNEIFYSNLNIECFIWITFIGMMNDFNVFEAHPVRSYWKHFFFAKEEKKKERERANEWRTIISWKMLCKSGHDTVSDWKTYEWICSCNIFSIWFFSHWFLSLEWSIKRAYFVLQFVINCRWWWWKRKSKFHT